jgi:hypothetical protein
VRAYPRCLPKGATVEERFLDKFVIDPETGCWLWRRPMDSGYGNFHTGRLRKTARTTYAHRFSYQSFYGPIPAGLCLDHICRVRRCVNPTHLRVVTLAENSSMNQSSRKSHCKRGHPLKGDNLIQRLLPVIRQCKICYNWKNREFERKKRKESRELLHNILT